MPFQITFYRGVRGPAPNDVDTWLLVLDEGRQRLFVRHEWTTARHGGNCEYDLAEFLSRDGPERSALVEHLFRTSRV